MLCIIFMPRDDSFEQKSRISFLACLSTPFRKLQSKRYGMWRIFILQIIDMVFCLFYLIQYILKTLLHQQGYYVFLESWSQTCDGFEGFYIRLWGDLKLYIFVYPYDRLLFLLCFRNRGFLVYFFDGRLYGGWSSFSNFQSWLHIFLLTNNNSSLGSNLYRNR